MGHIMENTTRSGGSGFGGPDPGAQVSDVCSMGWRSRFWDLGYNERCPFSAPSGVCCFRMASKMPSVSHYLASKKEIPRLRLGQPWTTRVLWSARIPKVRVTRRRVKRFLTPAPSQGGTVAMRQTWRLKPTSAAIVSLFIAITGSTLFAQRTQAPPASKHPSFPLKLSANKRYLVDQNDTPFLIVADSPQGLMGRLTEEEAESYFADREAQGFNALGWIDVACAGYDYPANNYAATTDGIRPFTAFLPGGSDYNFYDLSKPNEAYFVRLDHMLQLATRHHFAVFLDPMETIGWLPTLRRNGVQAAYAYGHFLGRRYGGFANVLWINGNDFRTWHASEEGALLAAAKDGIRSFVHTWRARNDDALVQAIAKGIRASAPRQLQTLELEPPTSSSFDDPAWRSLIDLNGTYTYFPAYIQTLHSYDQKPIAPTFLMETRYEFDHGDVPPDDGIPYILRKEEYWAMLSGGTGLFYGNAEIWPFKSDWRERIDTVGVQQVAHWKDFFLSLPWQNLIPDQDSAVLVAGSGSVCDLKTPVSQCDYALAAKSADGSVIVIYLPAVRTIRVNLAVLSHAAHATWFDPSNGAYRAISSGTYPNSQIQEFTPPGKNHSGDRDWVLLLRAGDSAPRRVSRIVVK